MSVQVMKYLEARRAAVLKWYHLGLAQPLIAKKLAESPVFVWRTITRYKETKSVCDRPRSGRPSTLNAEQKAKVKKMLKDPEVGSVRKVASDMKLGGKTNGRSVVHRAGAQTGVRAVRPQKKPMMTTEVKEQRYYFVANLWDDKAPPLQLNRVYSDEKLFLYNGTKKTIWIDIDEKIPFKAQCHCTHTPCPPMLFGLISLIGLLLLLVVLLVVCVVVAIVWMLLCQ